MTLLKSAPPSPLSRNLPWWLIALVAAIANFVAAHLTILNPVEGGPSHIATVMWAPTGITFALTWHYGRSAIVGATLGSFLFLLQVQGHPLFSAITALTTVLPSAYACWQLRRNGIDDPFSTPRNVAQFVFFAVFVTPMFSALCSLFAPLLSNTAEMQWDSPAWLALWVNGAIANSLIAPALVRLGDWREISKGKMLELIGITLSILLVWWGVFLTSPQTLTLPMTMLTAPFLILMAFRFNFGVVAAFSLLISVISLISLQHNPYGEGQNAFFLTCAYLSMLSLSILAVGAGSAALRATVTQLVRSEEALRGVFEQAAVGIVLFDSKGDSLVCNPKFGDMIGYPPDEITKETIRSIAFADEQEVTNELALQMQLGKIHNFNQEKRYTRKDGSVMWASLTMSLLRDKQGDGKLLIGIYEDITQRKRAEKQLEGQRRILRNLTADQSLPEILNELALFAEDVLPESCSGIFLADHKIENLHLMAAPSWPRDAKRPTTGIPIKDNVSPTISAAAQKKVVICSDILAAPEHVALYPLIQMEPWRRACWAVPFMGKTTSCSA